MGFLSYYLRCCPSSIMSDISINMGMKYNIQVDGSSSVVREGSLRRERNSLNLIRLSLSVCIPSSQVLILDRIPCEEGEVD